MSTILATASAVPAPNPFGDEEVGADRTMEHMLATLRAATEEQRTEMLGLLGVPAVPAKKVGTAVAKKTSVPAARKAAAAAPLPEPDEDGAPSADSYRIKEEDIDHAVCVGRILKGGKDKRWAPAVYREFQCGKANEDDCDLCKVCQNRLEKFAEDPKSKNDWNGRVTEDPHAGVHMLDTEWAEARKPKWMGEGAAAATSSDSGSEASASESAASSKVSKAAEKEAAKATKEAEKVSKAAKKEAEKAEKAAKKEAEKAEKAAKKEAEKAEKAAEKEAEKAAKAAEKEKEPKAKKAPAPKKAATPVVKKAVGGAGAAAPSPAPAKADSAAAAAEAKGEMSLIDGTIYWVNGKNVYKYDEDSEEAGEYVGRLTSDETIDKDAEEEDEE